MADKCPNCEAMKKKMQKMQEKMDCMESGEDPDQDMDDDEEQSAMDEMEEPKDLAKEIMASRAKSKASLKANSKLPVDKRFDAARMKR